MKLSHIVFAVVILSGSAKKSPCGKNTFPDQRGFDQKCPDLVVHCAAVGLKESQLRCEECCARKPTTEKSPTDINPPFKTKEIPPTTRMTTHKTVNFTQWNTMLPNTTQATEAGRDEDKTDKNVVVIGCVVGVAIIAAMIITALVVYRKRRRKRRGRHITKEGNPTGPDTLLPGETS